MTKKDSDTQLQYLLEMGTKGHYPIFPKSWQNKMKQGLNNNKEISLSEKKLVSNIVKQLSNHKKIEDKKTILFALDEEEQEIFLKVFIKQVEDKIINKKMELH